MQKARAEHYRDLGDKLRRIAEDVRGDRNRLVVHTAAKEFERIAQNSRPDNRKAPPKRKI